MAGTTYTDSFNRSGQLVGSTETGGGTWRTTGSAVPSTNGSYLNLNLQGQFAYLELGTGDQDVTGVVIGSGTVVVRKDAETQRAIRVRVDAQSYSSGGYVNQTQYAGVYSHPFCENSTSYQNNGTCGSSSFANMIYVNCYNGSGQQTSGYAFLQSVVPNGTCQTYQSSSYTVYTAYLEVVDAAGNVKNIGSVQVSYQSTIRLVAQGSRVTAYSGSTAFATYTDTDAASLTAPRAGLGSVGAGYYDSVSLTALNVAPDSPLVDYPANAAILDRTVAQTIAWTFKDTDPTDTQSKFDVSLRNVTAGTAATVTTETTNRSSLTLAAGTLAAGSWELTVRTYDSQGVASPWSPVTYFTAGNPPAAPILTTPATDGAAVPTQFFAVEWNTPAQDLYQVRRVADASGTANPATVYFDSGPVATPAARRASLDFSTNNRTEHVQVRISLGGLWSTWATRRVRVSYTPPAQPFVTAKADDVTGSIQVEIQTPAPQGTQPETLTLDLYRSGDRVQEERVATGLVAVVAGSGPRAITWTDWTPASGRLYRYRAEAFGSNGTRSSS